MTKITNFVWNPVDDCIISEVDEAGAVEAVYTNKPQQYGGVISQRRGTTTHYHHHDALGSTRALTVCEMEWNECSAVGGNRGQIAGQWTKFSPSDGTESGISGPNPPQCPGWFQQFIGDAPTLDEIDGAVKRVNFFVRAQSSVGCSCSSSEVSVAFNLVVETVKVDVLNPGKPPKFKPSPPVLKPGLDRTITGCDTLPGVV